MTAISHWREIADRIWVRRYEFLDQTIGVIGGARGLVVVDTRATHRLADELRRELAELPGGLWMTVNTHGHWDHAFGNARFRDRPILGHVRCATMIEERGDEMRRRIMAAAPPELGAEYAEVELVPPSELVDESVTIDLGDRLLEIRHLGRGHTDNDVVVRVPDASVLLVGDLLENAPAPAFGDSFPVAWSVTGRSLLGLVDGVVVPGHGDPFDIGFASAQVAQLDELAGLVRLVLAGGMGTDEAIRRSPFAVEETGDALERGRIELTE